MADSSSSSYGAIDSEDRRSLVPSSNLDPVSPLIVDSASGEPILQPDQPVPPSTNNSTFSFCSIMTIPYLGPMILMPSSLAVASYLVFFHPSHANSTHLFWALCRIGLFYAGWTIYKKIFQGDTQDLGHITMGFLAFVSYMQWPGATLIAASIIWLHYALAFYLVFVKLDTAEALAQAVKRTTAPVALVWAWVFRIYVCLNLVFWYMVVAHKLIPLVRDRSSYNTVSTAGGEDRH